PAKAVGPLYSAVACHRFNPGRLAARIHHYNKAMWGPILLRLSVATNTIALGVFQSLMLMPPSLGHRGYNTVILCCWWTIGLSLAFLLVGRLVYKGSVPKAIY